MNFKNNIKKEENFLGGKSPVLSVTSQLYLYLYRLVCVYINIVAQKSILSEKLLSCYNALCLPPLWLSSNLSTQNNITKLNYGLTFLNE